MRTRLLRCCILALVVVSVSVLAAPPSPAQALRYRRYTFTGHVYQGEPPDTTNPAFGVTVRLYGNQEEWSERGSKTLLTSTTTNRAGGFNLVWEPEGESFACFHIVEVDPPDTYSTGAQAGVMGRVANHNVISYCDIPLGNYGDIVFWDAATPTLEGWCCHNREVFQSSELECSRMEGAFLPTEREAREYCIAGWCCHEGRVSASLAGVCSELGGEFFGTQQEAQSYCTAGWCCYNQETFASSAGDCSAMGGAFFATERDAQLNCAMGWCCHRGTVLPSSERDCSRMEGAFLLTEQEAREYCVAGWCCHEGRVSASSAGDCSAMGGAFFATERDAELNCAIGWCCYNQETFASSAGDCSAMGGAFFATERDAQLNCAMGWCCYEGEVLTASSRDCSAMGGTFFSTAGEAKERCWRDFPPPPTGWCCYEGSVFPAQEGVCSFWGGVFFATREDTEEYCQSVPPTPVCPQPDAAGNTFEAAASLSPFVETQEYICPSGDVDWWKLFVDVGQEITVYLYDLPTAPAADYDLFLFDPNGILMASSERFGAARGEFIRYTGWVSGEWRIMVRGKGYGTWGAADWSKTIPYKLRADLAFSCYVPDEAGDTFADATPLMPSIPQASVSRPQLGYLCPKGDRDFYKIQTSGGQYEVLEVHLTDLPADFDLRLYRPDGSLYDTSAATGKVDEQITAYIGGLRGAWVVEVYGKADGAGGTIYHGHPYRLEVSLTSQADLTVEWIEITQAIQDMDNSVPLVIGRPTYVRVYLDIGPVDGPVYGVEIDLYGWREDGWGMWKALPGSPLRIGPYPVEKPVGPVANRQRVTEFDSWVGYKRFPLPYSWHLPGSKIHLKAVVNPDKSIAETDFANNTLMVSGRGFAKEIQIDVCFVPVKAGGLVPDLTDNADLNAMTAFLWATFPVGKVNWRYKIGGPLKADYDYTFPGDGTCGKGWAKLLSDLEDLYDAWKNRPVNAFIVGLLEKVPPSGGGCGAVGRHVSACYVSEWSYGTLAHELGHNLGRLHAPCGVSPADEKYPDYKNPDGSALPSGSIGEVGFNVFAHYVLKPQTVYNPFVYSDFMSYCSPKWVSPYTYEAMFWKLSERHGIPWVPASSAGAAHSSYLVTSGIVYDGQIDVPRPFWIEARPAGSHDELGSGSYSLELQDAEGTALFVRHFDPNVGFSGPDTGCGYFREIVPFAPQTARIVLRHQGETLRLVEVSSNAPTVTVLSPNGGESWDGSGPYTITWEAYDADGDPLVARVLYSFDGGDSWEFVAMNVLSDHYTVDASDLPGSDSALIKVEVSDGVNTTADVSDGFFSVPNKAPLVLFLSPNEGDRLPAGQSLIFAGLATDPEEGPVADDSLSWFSDLDGFLGVGSNLMFAGLSCGKHEITLRATDSDGNMGMATARVHSTLIGSGSLSVTPGLVRPGETVTVSAEVTNTGVLAQGCSVMLLIDGIEEDTKDVFLAPGTGDTVTFTVSRATAGTYAVEIDGLSNEFTVIASYSRVVGGLISAAVLLGLVVLLIVRRNRKASSSR